MTKDRKIILAICIILIIAIISIGIIPKVIKRINATKAILKSRSPSCGSNIIYDGTFTKTLIDGDGVTAKLLKENGIEVISSDDL